MRNNLIKAHTTGFVEAGKLDRRITIQYFTGEKDKTGEVNSANAWQELAELPRVWANVQERDGREAFESDRLTAEATTFFTIRYREDVTTQMRIVYHNSPYEILSISEVGRKDLLRILASRKDHNMRGDTE